MVGRGFFPSAQGSNMVDASFYNRRCIGLIFLVISKVPIDILCCKWPDACPIVDGLAVFAFKG